MSSSQLTIMSKQGHSVNQTCSSKGAEGGLLLSKYHKGRELQQFVNFDSFHGFEEIKDLFDAEPPENSDKVAEPVKIRPHKVSLEILTNYESRVRRINGEKIKIPRFGVRISGVKVQKLSTIAILRLAGEKFIDFSNSETYKRESSALSLPNASSSLVGVPEEDKKNLELVLHLLSAVDKMGKRQFHQAKKHVKKCKKRIFEKGNPIERLVYHLSSALRERIDRETGKCSTTWEDLGRMATQKAENELLTVSSTLFGFQKVAPFYPISQFTGMQVIIEQVEGAKKVHIIDLQIRLGTQYTLLIQALAARTECPVDMLKVTALATNSKEPIEETGRRLTSFAESFNLPFSFRILMVDDILDLHQSLFEVEEDEAVAVYSEFYLKFMLACPDRLEWLMGVIRSINPCIMVVTEVEANHNSPVFANRFSETLFYHGAFFDAFEDCLKGNDAERLALEKMFGQGLKNILVSEKNERIIRHVKINVWRDFFARYGMLEVEFSRACTYQANLLLQKFPFGSSCTIETDGKCLILGWKGTPIKSVSAWIFV